MMRVFCLLLLSLLILIFSIEILAADKLKEGDAAEKILAQYVAKPDATTHWKTRQETRIGKTTVVEITLTSQSWQNIPWRHQLFLLKPSILKNGAKHALLTIGGGRWHKEYAREPKRPSLPREVRLLAPMAEQLGTPVAVLLQVPQQPMFGGLVEDELISLTFEKFVRTGDSQWPLLLPMVKSVARAMDTITEFSEKEWSHKIETYTLTGASKRGWTTWLTGAVDPRATAIAPMVIDMLNMRPHLQLQLDAWGNYSHQIHDYTDRGLPRLLETSPGKRLQQIVDPYFYRAKLKQPKLIILGTNDAYWPLDAANLYWNDLHGEKYLLYVPNNGHGLRDRARVLGSISALHQQQAGGPKLPKLTWDFKNGGDHLLVKVQSDIRPKRVQAWMATSTTRDFRQSTWKASPAQEIDGHYTYQMLLPKNGHAAIFCEAVYNGQSTPFYLSTNVQIVGKKAREPGRQAP